jgi:pimeloyl-ACP methyl ester carboxylesterase
MTQDGRPGHGEIADDATPDARTGDPPAPRIVGSGPTLVLVPGIDGTGRLFHRQIPLLARAFRVVSYALRDSAVRMDTLVDDLTALIDRVSPGGEPVVVCGESFGGALALSLAIRRPERVRALVVINSFARFLPQHRLDAAIVALRLMPWGAMPLVRRLTAFRLHSRFTHRTEIRRFLAETRQTTRAGYLNRLRILTEYDARPHLGRIARPTLFVASDRDHLVPAVAQARYMVARVPGARLHVLEGHGHICLIAPGVDLARIIADWGGIPGVPRS